MLDLQRMAGFGFLFVILVTFVINMIAYFAEFMPGLRRTFWNLCCNKNDSRSWDEYEDHEHDELIKQMTLKDMKKRLEMKVKSDDDPRGIRLNIKVEAEYDKRIEEEMDKICRPIEKKYIRDEFGMIYH